MPKKSKIPFKPCSLPKDVHQLLIKVAAPPRLRAHLTLVHDTGCHLLAHLARAFPTLHLNNDDILFGAATHDVGKVIHPEELTGPGTQHEQAGSGLLEQSGINPRLARFARTHGSWRGEEVAIEDLLVALADHVWKGVRNEDLELLVAKQLATATGGAQWTVWLTLDEVLTGIASEADQRVAW